MKKDAPFVIAWVKELLKEARKNNDIFMEETCFEVEAEDYILEFDEEKNKIMLKFLFKVEDEKEVLNLSGHLVKSKDNKVGIDWQKEQGNEFWLGSIISHINQQMKVLA